MEPDEKNTPEAAPKVWRYMKPKSFHLEQMMADQEAYGFVVPADEMDD